MNDRNELRLKPLNDAELALIDDLREVQKERQDYQSWTRLDSHVERLRQKRMEKES